MIAEGLRLGKYLLGAELGRGGMGAVYRAESVAEGPAGPSGTVVAVKVFHSHLASEPGVFERFQREAQIGMQIRHPHVVGTYEIGSQEVDGETLHFMAMDFIQGQTLADLLKELGTVPEHLRVQIADQVLDALDAVHARGVVHRDIKPENIVITPDHKVLLMDLGVARLQGMGHTLTQAGEFVGSLAYAAPEQFVPEDDEVGPKTDLYAFGIVLFELATGRNPFDVDHLPTLLQKKLQSGTPPPRSLNAEVDAFWNEFILTATKKDAGERFESAAQMRAILLEGEASEWWRARQVRVARPAAESALKRLRLEREAPLIGRSQLLDTLRRAWERAQVAGGVLLLGGSSGVGKSRLLYDFLEQVASDGGPSVAAARCVGAGGRSYQPFVEALQDLLVPPAAGPVERRIALETKLAPLLADTPGVVPPFVDFLLGGIQPGTDATSSKDALLATCARVLERLAAERPLVLAVDDLHLAGTDSVEMFSYLSRCVPGHALLLVGVYSDDEVEEGSPVHALVAAPTGGGRERLTVTPLDDAGVEDLVRAVVRSERTVRALARPLFERGEGNAFLVLEMLAHLRAEGALVAARGGFDLVHPLDVLAVPSTVRDVVGLKLSRLDDEQRETLEVAAVLGYGFEAPLLAAVLGQNRIHLLKRLAVLERKNRLVVSAGASGFRFASRRLYETVYGAINPGLRGEYHGLVADTLLASPKAGEGRAPDGPTAYSLLRHLVEAGRALEAEPHLETALEHLGANFHASYAAPFLERVAAAFERAAPAPRFAIAMRLWTFYELLASRADQLRVIEGARDLADRIGEPGPRARVHACRAGSYWYAGEYEKAAAEAAAGLELARAAGDRKGEATCQHTLGAVAFRRGEIEESARCLREALRIRREIRDRRGEASTLQALALVMPGVGQRAEVLPAMEEALRIWREVGERRGEAAVQMNIGLRLVDDARFDEGLKYLELAIAGHRETGALLNEAMALANLGFAQEILGRIDAARVAWDRALRLFVDLGDPNGETVVRSMLGTALSAYGETDEARKHLEAAIALATKSGAKSKLAAAHRELGRLLHRTGDRAAGWTHLDRALALEGEAKNVSSRVETLSALGSAALAEGDAPRAVGFLLEALPDARKDAGSTAATVLCRLALAHRACGRPAEAADCAREALAGLQSAGNVSPRDGPEIYATLAEVLTERREELLARARAMTEERARHIRDEAVRERFLARNWPGREGGAAPAAPSSKRPPSTRA